MRIDSFEIRNFHGIEQADYDLHPSVTVLLGANATGKSAILDALAVLAGSYFLGVDGVPSPTITSDDIRQELQFLNDGSTRRIHHTPCVLTAKGEVHGVKIKWKRDRLSQDGKTRSAEAKKVEEYASRVHKILVEGGFETRPFLGYYSVARLGAQKKETAVLKQALTDLGAGYMNALNKEGSQRSAERWFAGFQGRAFGEMGQAKPNFEAAKSKLLSLFKGAETPLTDIYYDSETSELFARFGESAGFIPASSLSSGYKSVLWMGLDIIWRIYSLNSHLGVNVFDETPGFALIDETDMHLHPKWQGYIIDDLRNAFPMLQFVFTTHSPFVVQSLRHARIIDLDAANSRDVGEFVKKSIPEVAEEYMGMAELERSPYFMDQVKAAEEYFTLLKSPEAKDPEKLAALKARLDEFEIRYDRDPAFIGLLRAERNTSKVDKA